MIPTRIWPNCLMLLVILVLLHGLAPTPGFCGTEGTTATGSNQVKGVKPFPLDFDSGSMALHALGSSLEAYGQSMSYHRVVAMSGTAFKFVYDTTEAYEPLRDLYPIDALKTASDGAGFRDAHWETDKPIEVVKAIVKGEIDKGRTVIAPFLKDDPHRGFFIITGYDFDSGIFYLQGAFSDSTYVTVPVPKTWDGPTVSPMGWATNPIFVIGALDESQQQDRGLDRALVVTGIDMLKGGNLPYGVHEGEKAYMRSGGSHEAAYGIPAYRLLSWDIEKRDLTVRRDGEDTLNFGLVWRIDSQLGQLEHDRKYAATALNYLISRVAGGKSVEVQAIIDNIEKTTADVKDIRKIFWDKIPESVNSVDALLQYVRSSKSIVFSFAGRDRFFADLRNQGLQVFKTQWGPMVVDDSRDKRLRAKIMVKSLEARERASLRMMEEIVNYIADDLGVPRLEPTAGKRHRK